MTGSISAPRGLVPVRNMGGNNAGTLKRYHVSANNPQPIWQGVPVYLAGNGNVRARVTGTVASFNVLGVAQAFEDANGKPLMFQAPTRGPYLPSSTEGYVHINDNPFQVYSIETETTATRAMIGAFADVTGVITGVTGTGISRVKLKTSDTSVTGGTGLAFKIVGLSPFNFSRQHEGFTEVEVVIVNQTLYNANKS